jgi:cation diffusion facilitator family transporter
MQKLLIRLFIKDAEAIQLASVRQQYGRLSSIVGITVNFLLFMAKFTVGTLFHSVAVTGDAVNNLSDAGSSIISLVSFKLSGKPADKDHPFGHARIEYIASSIVAVLILLLGVELIKSSFAKVLKPDPVAFNWLTIIVLGLSIATKLWLYRFNNSLGKKIQSSMMQATAADSLSDVMATSAVLVSMVASPLIHFQLDGYMGILVALFILFSGYRILKETLDRILGQVPTSETVQLIDAFIRQYEGVMGLHDLVVHDYGPHRNYASVHVEVDAGAPILQSHDLIDNIEHDIRQAHDINLVIHLDPIVKDDPDVNRLRLLVAQVIQEIDGSLTFHDFRLVKGQTHSNLIFDVLAPHQDTVHDQALIAAIQAKICERDPRLWAVINIDRAMIPKLPG